MVLHPARPRERYGLARFCRAFSSSEKFRVPFESATHTQPMQRHCQSLVKPLILLTNPKSARVVLEAGRCNVRVTEIRRRATSRRPSLHKTSSVGERSEPSSTSSKTNLKGGLSARNAGRDEPGRASERKGGAPMPEDAKASSATFEICRTECSNAKHTSISRDSLPASARPEAKEVR